MKMAIYLYNILSIPVYRLFIKDKKIFTLTVSVQMFLIMAFRDITIGADLKNYANGFQYIRTLGLAELLPRLRLFQTADLIYRYSYESGYVVLNWVLAKLGCSFHDMLIVFAAFNMISFGCFIYRYSKIPWLSFVLLSGLNMYEYAFGILRQSLAVCIVLWAVPYILEKKYGKACLILLFAFMFHRTSLVFFLLLVFAEKPFTRKRFQCHMAVWVGMLAVTPVFYEKILSKILILLGKGRYTEVNFRLNNQIILMVGIALVIYLLIDLQNFVPAGERLILRAYLLSIPVEIIGMCNDSFARSIEYYYIFVILLIPAAIATYQYRLDYATDQRLSYDEIKWSAVIRFFAMLLVVILTVLLMVHNLRDSLLVPYRLYRGI